MYRPSTSQMPGNHQPNVQRQEHLADAEILVTMQQLDHRMKPQRKSSFLSTWTLAFQMMPHVHVCTHLLLIFVVLCLKPWNPLPLTVPSPSVSCSQVQHLCLSYVQLFRCVRGVFWMCCVWVFSLSNP